jgi:hypothetical protein
MMQLPCCLARVHAQLHGLFAHHLAVAALAVQREQGAGVEHDAYGGVGLSPPSSTAST